MASDGSAKYVHAILADGTEVFGVDAFPFRQGHRDVVAFDVSGERRVLTSDEATFRVLDPELLDKLPSRALWEQANDDDVLRRAVKDRCGL